MEPLLVESPRPSLYPLWYPKIWEMYKQAVSLMWTPEEVNLEEDVEQWTKKLTGEERAFLSPILSFFVRGDDIVGTVISEHVMKMVKVTEVAFFYGWQNAIENIHFEMYNVLVERLIKDADERIRVLSLVDTLPAVKTKADWASEKCRGEFAETLVGFAIVEGLFFASSFAAVFWFRRRGLLPGVIFSNELVSKDEALHCKFACLLYREYLVRKLPEERVIEMFREAVEIEKGFFVEVLPADLPGMNAALMGRYVEFVADQLLKDLGHRAIFDSKNPFDFMTNAALENKTNFFERKVSNYQLPLRNTSFRKDAYF